MFLKMSVSLKSREKAARGKANELSQISGN